MREPLSRYQAEMVQKKSRFVGVLCPVFSVDEIEIQKATIAAEFPDAKHIAYAYRVMDEGQIKVRFFDAGEPSGTAGKPIFAHIEGRDIINCIIFAIRYFGGIKLGVGGLVRAYGETARLVLEAASSELIEYAEWSYFTVSIGYGDLDTLKFFLKNKGVKIVEEIFLEDVSLVIGIESSVASEILPELTQRLSGTCPKPLVP